MKSSVATCALLFATLGAAQATPAAAQDMYSGFDSSVEGWTWSGDASGFGRASLDADGDTTSGSLYIKDGANGATTYAISPALFRGDLRDRASISLNLRVELASGATWLTGRRPLFTLQGGGVTARYLVDGSYFQSGTNRTWGAFEAPLEAKYWQVSGGTFEQLLANVQAFNVLMEYANGGEKNYIDNVLIASREGSTDDLDGDGWSPAQRDLDDADPTVYPGAPELCDGLDNDLDGQPDEDMADCLDGLMTSTFDFDLEGWTLVQDYAAMSWSPMDSRGDLWSGSFYEVDQAVGQAVSAVAPPKFDGNWLGRMWLCVDLRVEIGSGATWLTGPRPVFRLTGNGITATFSLDGAIIKQGNKMWVTYMASLLDDAAWTYSVSGATLDDVLENVESLQVGLEYTYGKEYNRFDNILVD